MMYPVPGQAAQMTVNSVSYHGDGYDYTWSAEPLPTGGFALVITSQSFGALHYGGYDGFLWLLKVGPSGSIEGSWMIETPYPMYFYDSALLGDSILVAGTSYDYRRAVVGRIGLDGAPIFFLEVTPTGSAYASFLVAVEVVNESIYVIGSFYDLDIGQAVQWVLELDPGGGVVSSMGYVLGSPYYWPLPLSASIYGDVLVVAGYGYTNPGYVYGVNISSWSPLWAYSLGDSSGDDMYGVSYNGYGVTVTGAIDDYGGEDMLVANISVDGTLNWAYRISTPGTDRGFGAMYREGYVYVAGWGQPGLGRYGNDTLAAKVSVDGRLEWVRILGVPGDDWAYTIHVDQDGYVYLIGGAASEGNDDPIIMRLTQSGTMPCPLQRKETPLVEPYTLQVEPVTLTPRNYTSITITTALMVSTREVQPAMYTLCPMILGGQAVIQAGTGQGVQALLAGALAIIALASARITKGRNRWPVPQKAS